MYYLAFIVALSIVLLFGFWSGRRPRKSYKTQEAKVYPLRKAKQTNNLRRVK